MKKESLIGRRFGTVVVKEEIGKNRFNRTMWKCECDCGKVVIKDGGYLKYNVRCSKNCGCKSSRFKDLTGLLRGRLTVVSFWGYKSSAAGNKRACWNCKCNCGKEVVVGAHELKERKTLSCGCLAAEKTRERQWQGYGGISKTVFNKIIESAKKRDLVFEITIEDVWILFQKQKGKCAISGISIYFGEKTRDGTQTASLDRIDSKKGYTKDNIQWVHKIVQTMKWNFKQNDFITWCKIISKNNGE